MQMPQVVLNTVSNPGVQYFVLCLLSAWSGLLAHLLKKNLHGVKTAKQLRKYFKMHFTTILLSLLLGIGIAATALKGFIPGASDIFEAVAAAAAAGYIGDSFMEIPRKSQEQSR
jgi:hypothetical protein